ncbi:MAG TPA: hypothetical protein VN732_10230, partial [Solirubrobacterales bacterium]|nr:hypothetical protein [Solirubrobacterales bacterium]
SGYYKTFLWGWNSICFEQGDEFTAPPEGSAPRGRTSKLEPGLKKFREATLVNTYGETAPLIFPEGSGKDALAAVSPVNLHIMHGFYVGPSRVSLQPDS